MIVLGIILLVIGALVAYFGRPREQLIYWAGLIIFVVGVILVILGVLDASDVKTAAVEYVRSSWGHRLRAT
jgi:Flp pilus assembly protein protease CpaA